jgi:hypothetical protein
MNFTQVVAEVVETIKRPDLINRARREVNSSISFYCLDNEFSRDFQEQIIVLDPLEYTQSFALSDMTRFRKFKYLRRGDTKKYLSVISDEEMIKGCTINDKYYIAGLNVNVSLKARAATLDVGYYMHPPILTDNAPEFWLLDVSPFMVVDRACAAVFRSIGDEKSMQTHAISARESYLTARKDLGISTQ